jgi:hypothetical protein
MVTRPTMSLKATFIRRRRLAPFRDEEFQNAANSGSADHHDQEQNGRNDRPFVHSGTLCRDVTENDDDQRQVFQSASSKHSSRTTADHATA